MLEFIAIIIFLNLIVGIIMKNEDIDEYFFLKINLNCTIILKFNLLIKFKFLTKKVNLN